MEKNLQDINDTLYKISQDNFNRDSITGLPGVNKLTPQSYGMSEFMKEQANSDINFSRTIFGDNNIGLDYLNLTNNNPSSYDKDITEYNQLQDLRSFRANEQSPILKATNAIIGGAVSGLATFLEDVGYILDFENHYQSFAKLDQDRDNWLSSSMRDFKEGLYNALPIYETESDTALGQFFKFSTLRGIIDSTVGFGIAGGAVVKGLRAIAKLSRLGSVVDKALAVNRASAGTKVLANILKKGVKDITAGAITNYAEGQMMAIELGEQAKQNYISSKAEQIYNQFKDAPIPISMENAFKLAEDEFNRDTKAQKEIGKEQSEFVNRNRIFMLIDAIGLHGLTRSKGGLRQSLLKNPKEKLASLKNLSKLSSDNPLLLAIKEGSEEISQNVLQKEGEYQVRKATGTTTEEDELLGDDFWTRAFQFGTSKQAIVEGLMGAVSGPGQRAVAKITSNIRQGDFLGKKQKEELFKRYTTQQNFIKDIDSKVSNIVKAESLRAEAFANGDEITADAMWDKEASDLVLESIKNGTIEALERSTQDIIENPNKTSEEKQQAKKLLDFINNSENEYLLASKHINSLEVYENRARHYILENWAKNLQEDINKKVSEVNNSLEIKGADYRLNLSPDYTIANNIEKALTKDADPKLLSELNNRLSQYKKIKSELKSIDNSYKNLVTPEYQESWLKKEVKKQIDQAKKLEEQAILSKSNIPLIQVDENRKIIPSARAKVVKDGDNYYLRHFDDELNTYSLPMLRDEMGNERPVTSEDLESFIPETVDEEPTAPPVSTAPEVKFFTEKEKKSLREEVSNITDLEDLDNWYNSHTINETLSEEAFEELGDLYHKAKTRITTKTEPENISTSSTESNSEADILEDERTDNYDGVESSNSLWDPPLRISENYWFGSRGSEVASRKKNETSQVKWFDFLNSNDLTKFRGIIIPFSYNGELAGRLVITDKKGNFVDYAGNPIGKEFNPDTCIYTTVSDIKADPKTAKYYGSIEEFNFFKDRYYESVWTHLEKGLSVPVTFTNVSSGVIDSNYRNVVVKKPYELKPLRESIPENFKLEDLTVYVSSNGQITTKEGKTFIVPAGTAAIQNKKTKHFYRANSIPINAKHRELIIDLFKLYANNSIAGKKSFVSNSTLRYKVGDQIIEKNFLSLLRDILRYSASDKVSGDPARIIRSHTNNKGYITRTWTIGENDVDIVVPDAKGNLVLNDRFFDILDKFLKDSFFNIRASLMDPKNTTTYYFPVSINNDGTINTEKYSNYHNFVRANLVDFVDNINSPYTNVERYAIFEPSQVNTVAKSEPTPSVPNKPIPSKNISKLKDIIDTLDQGSNIEFTFTVNGDTQNKSSVVFTKKNNLYIPESSTEGLIPNLIAGRLNDKALWKNFDKFTIQDTGNQLAEEISKNNPNIKITSLDITSRVIEPITQPNVELDSDTEAILAEAEALLGEGLTGDVVVSSDIKYSISNSPISKDTTKELEAAKDWFTKKFPEIDFNIVRKAATSRVLGEFHRGAVTLYTGATTRTAYHEAFHVVFACALTEEERSRIIKEAINNPEYKDYFKREKDNYPNLSKEELAEEVLAEVFSDYLVLREESNSFIKRIFDKIKELISWIFNHRNDREWTNSISSIAEYVSKHNFNTKDFLNTTVATSKQRVIEGLDPITTNDAVNSTHCWFIQYFKDKGNLIDIIQSDNAKIVAEAYDNAKNQFKLALVNTVNTLKTAQLNSDEKTILLNRVKNISTILKSWDSETGIKALHSQTKLAQYKLELTSEDNYQEAAAEISGGENNQGRDSAQLFSEAITVSSKFNSNKVVKLLLSTLFKKTYDPKTRTSMPYLNSLGMNEVEDYGKVFNIIANKLANISTSISASELKDLLSNLGEEYPAIYQLINDETSTILKPDGTTETKTIQSWLKLDSPETWSASDALQVIQFIQAFNNNKNNYVIGITNKNGQYKLFDASIVGQRDRIKASWRADLIQNLLENKDNIASLYRKNAKKEWEYNSAEFKKRFPSVPFNRSELEFLKYLGITFNIKNPTVLETALKTQEFKDKVANLWQQITTGKLIEPVVFESRESLNENLDVFLDIQSNYGIETLENSHISISGERVYNLQKPGFINQTINKLNRVIKGTYSINRELYYLNPENNLYTTHSLLLKNILENKSINTLSLLIHEGSIEGSRESTGVEYKDLKLTDKLSIVLNLTMEGKDNIMRPADNGQERFLDHEEPWVNINTPRREIFEIFRGYLWDELARSHEKDRSFTNLSKNFNKGPLIETLLTKEEQSRITDDERSPESFATAIIDSIGRDVLNSRITNFIETLTNNAYNEVLAQGIISERQDSKIVNFGLKINKETANSILNKEDVIKWLRIAVINYAIGNIEQSKILYGDNVFYKTLGDEFKRHNGAMGAKKTCLTGEMINNAIKNHFKRMDGAEALVDSQGNPILRTAIFSDVHSYSKELYAIAETIDKDNPKYQSLKEEVEKDYELSDKSRSFKSLMTTALIKNADKLGLNCAVYADMTEGDGFGMISLDAYRELKLRVGDWTVDSEKLYQWEVQVRNKVPVKERVFKDFYGNTTLLKYGDWGDQVFNPLKPQYYGPLANVTGYKPSFYKLSLMPLIPSVLKSLGNSNLRKLHDLMTKNQIGVVVHSSANKGVTTKTNSVINEEGVKITNKEHPFNDFYNEEGQFNINSDGTYTGPLNLLTQDTFWEYWGIQVDTGEHKHHDVITGTQMMVQILNGLFDGGEVSEQFGDNKEKVQSLVDEYISLNNQRIELGRQALIRELGLIATENGWKISETGIESLVRSLKAEAIERGLADNYITAIELLRELKDGYTNIDLLPTREKIESILMSRAASMTTSQKRNGTAAYQVPSTMWETTTTREYDDGKFRSSDLNFVIQTIGDKVVVKSMEVYLPSPFKGITDVGRIPKELLQLIGFRIPTQGLSSIETIVVKGFLPETAGDIIVLPSEIVAKAGSD